MMHKHWRRPCRPAQAEQPEEHLVGQWGQDRGLYTLNYAKRDEREESPEEKKNRGKFDHVTNLLDMLCYAACCVMHARIRDMHKQLYDSHQGRSSKGLQFSGGEFAYYIYILYNVYITCIRHTDQLPPSQRCGPFDRSAYSYSYT